MDLYRYLLSRQIVLTKKEIGRAISKACWRLYDGILSLDELLLMPQECVRFCGEVRK